MAEPTKPGQGVIVRADFGGGIDQSMDAWRVPPNQLSELVNGRLEKVGSIRKRTGYQPAPEPKPSLGSTIVGGPGNPINAAASSTQTVVIDAARILPLNPAAGDLTDQWDHVYLTVQQGIAEESGYVARNYSPTTDTVTSNGGWTTTGPASDVIGDVRILDGNAGSIDECVDYIADGQWIFVVKCGKAVNENTTGVVVVSMYDADTGVLVSENRQVFTRARVYPKIINPTSGWLLVAVADYSQSGTATPYTGTVEFLTYSYSSSGIVFSGVEPTDAVRNGIDYFPIQIFVGVPEQKYRPAVPFDIVDVGSSNFIFAAYRTNAGDGLRTAAYNFTAPGVTLTANVTHTAGIGANPIQALSLGRASGFLILSAFSAPFTAGAFPPYNAANYDLHVGRFNYTTCALIDYAVRGITRQAGATPFPGRLTVYQQLEDNSSNGNTIGIIEVYETGVGYSTATHTLFIVHGLGSALTVERRSYAIPAGRAFPLTYFPYVMRSTGKLTMQGRVPLIVGASQQSVYGLNTALPTQPPTTNYASNYSASIGTQILAGVEQLPISLVNSPFQTYAPKLQPCPPPKSFQYTDRGVTKIAVPHLVAIDGSNGFAIGMVTLQQRSAGDVQPSTFADLPVFPGGIVQQSDGERFAEVALVDRPVIHQIVASNAGTTWQMTPGDYLVQAIAAYRDSAGNVHRSTPSDPFRMVQAAAPNTGRTLSITFSYQSYTNRNDVQIEFYCTEPNGTVLRYWFSAPNVISLDFNVATIHDPSFSTTAPQLGAIGLPALDAPTLYTTGGVLPNVPIPSARFSTLYKNRMIVGGSDDPKSIYYSNGPQAYQAASFAVGNVIRMEHEGGCTAAGALNDKLILFSANGIYATFGQFRDSTGAGDALADLESIHDYIGCTQPISVVSIPVGLLFFATDGRFYMIDERLGLSPVGLRVQELTQAGLNTVRAAVHIEKEREVRFYMQDQLAATACILVYNYQIDQWSRDVVQATVGGIQTTLSSWGGACFSRDFKCLVVTDAAWRYDDGSSYYDETYWVRVEAKTAWIQPGGTQDYARFRNAQFLGRTAAPHNLIIRVFCDFDETNVRATGTWTAAQLAPIANTVWPEQVRLQVGTQKTQAVKIQIYDDPPTGATTGQGPQLIGLALEVLPLGGMKRLPAVRKA